MTQPNQSLANLATPATETERRGPEYPSQEHCPF